jgi:hypothetical protein
MTIRISTTNPGNFIEVYSYDGISRPVTIKSYRITEDSCNIHSLTREEAMRLARAILKLADPPVIEAEPMGSDW